METLLSLSLWPWFLAAAHAFAATLFFAPGVLQGRARSGPTAFFYVWAIGGAAVVAVLAGVIEQSNAGLLAGRDTAGVLELIALLAVFGAMAGLLPMMAAVNLPAFGQKKRDGT